MRLILLILSLLTLTFSHIHAQAESAPLYFLNDGGIYALSIENGTPETLVAPPADYQALHESTFDPVTLFSAEWMSPDGEYLAYRVLSGGSPIQAGGDPVYTQSLYLLNLSQGGDPLEIPLKNQDATRNTVESIAWSNDGTLMYALITTQTPRQADPQWSTLIFERGAWDTPLTVPLDPPDYAMGRSLFAIDEGVVMWDSGIQSPLFQFEVFNTTGEPLNTFSIGWDDVSPDVNLYTNIPLNPLVTPDGLRFGLNNFFTSELILQADFLTGEIAPPESGAFASMISRQAPETSISVSISQYDGDYGSLLFRDTDNHTFDYLEAVKLHAFGLRGDSIGSTITLSPDGQTLAFVQDGMIYLRHAEETTPLEVRAQVIAWQSPYYVPISDLAFLMG